MCSCVRPRLGRWHRYM
ncbi:hypothetical protein F383_10890 [Gossypium arboreum]|uniref:Uncharacterized protein n=1 Tax=Gossypium arboreum TaxID=29729 RepID=A0A0B0Q2L8_GOSAR|nr:hypothetical protein F383_10890 [Gossypium arboreum]